MSITNKKIDALRRLLLGPLYDQCKENPMGVKRDVLEAHLKKIQAEGCIGECTLDEFVKTCQLSSHYPTCALSGDYRECIEGIGEKSRGVEKVYYDQYKRAKYIEDEPDEEEEEEEGEMCNACYLTGTIDGNPVEQMSCGHYSHKSCLITQAQTEGSDKAKCPECKKKFSLEEVPVPSRTLEQRQRDSARRANFYATQMGLDPYVNEETVNVEEIDVQEEELTEEGMIIREIYLGNYYIAYEQLRRANDNEASEININNIFDSLLNRIKTERRIHPGEIDDINDFYDEILRGGLKIIREDLELMIETYNINNRLNRFIKNMLTRYIEKIFENDIEHIAQSNYLKDIFIIGMTDFIKITFEIFRSSSRLELLKRRVESIRESNPNIPQESLSLIREFLSS